jgi:hypothetical protein
MMIVSIIEQSLLGSSTVTIILNPNLEEEYPITDHLTSIFGTAIKIVITDADDNVIQSLVDPAIPLILRSCDEFFTYTDTTVNAVIGRASYVFVTGEKYLTMIGQFGPDWNDAVSEETGVHIIYPDDYIDFDKQSAWVAYNNKSTIFCDIDGTIIKAQTRLEYNNQPEAMTKSINILLEAVKAGSKIIFTTARLSADRHVTTMMLESLGFDNFELIMDLLNAKRVIINDYNTANPFPRAVAINVIRDSDTLDEYKGNL